MLQQQGRRSTHNRDAALAGRVCFLCSGGLDEGDDDDVSDDNEPDIFQRLRDAAQERDLYLDELQVGTWARAPHRARVAKQCRPDTAQHARMGACHTHRSMHRRPA